MLDGSVIEVVAVYSGCQEYHGEATLHYFDDALAGTKTETPEHRAAPLPPGLPFSVVLIDPIDTDTAAAGDIVRARIRKPVRDPDSKLVLVPTGAVVQGRIIHRCSTRSASRGSLQLPFSWRISNGAVFRRRSMLA
jgi:hypothetical protein